MWEDGQTEEGEKEKSGGLSQQRLLQSAAPPSTSVDRLNAPISTNPTLSDTFSFSAWMGLNHSEKIVFQEDKPRRCRGERGEELRSSLSRWAFSSLSSVTLLFKTSLCSCVFVSPPPTCEGWFWMGFFKKLPGLILMADEQLWWTIGLKQIHSEQISSEYSDYSDYSRLLGPWWSWSCTMDISCLSLITVVFVLALRLHLAAIIASILWVTGGCVCVLQVWLLRKWSQWKRWQRKRARASLTHIYIETNRLSDFLKSSLSGLFVLFGEHF